MSTQKQIEHESGTILEEEHEVELPKKYNVVLLNDDFTPIDFVVGVLVEIFRRNIDEAEAITNHIHLNGKGVAGTYTKEIAEEKKNKTLKRAKDNEHPLRCKIEIADPQPNSSSKFKF